MMTQESLLHTLYVTPLPRPEDVRSELMRMGMPSWAEGPQYAHWRMLRPGFIREYSQWLADRAVRAEVPRIPWPAEELRTWGLAALWCRMCTRPTLLHGAHQLWRVCTCCGRLWARPKRGGGSQAREGLFTGQTHGKQAMAEDSGYVILGADPAAYQCRCDPPGSGEEFCTGACYVRAAGTSGRQS